MFNGGAFSGGAFEHEINGFKGVVVSRVIQDTYELDPKLNLAGGGGFDFRHDLSPISFALGGLPSEYMQDRAIELLDAAGAKRSWRFSRDPWFPQVHLLGTCRMGNDSKTSVVDRNHRAHDVPNLIIVDGSSFVTSGRGQPTMTIQALAFRAAELASHAAKRGELS